jgi:hypothetical protein
LTEAQSEYSKALRAAAAAREKIPDHERETKDEHLSRRRDYPKSFFCARSFATDFATEYFGHEKTRLRDIGTLFS